MSPTTPSPTVARGMNKPVSRRTATHTVRVTLGRRSTRHTRTYKAQWEWWSSHKRMKHRLRLEKNRRCWKVSAVVESPTLYPHPLPQVTDHNSTIYRIRNQFWAYKRQDVTSSQSTEESWQSYNGRYRRGWASALLSLVWLLASLGWSLSSHKLLADDIYHLCVTAWEGSLWLYLWCWCARMSRSLFHLESDECEWSVSRSRHECPRLLSTANGFTLCSFTRLYDTVSRLC